MKILFLSAANSIHTVRWVNALAQRDHEIHLVFNAGHDPKDHAIDQRVHLHRLKHSGTKGYYLNAFALSRLAKTIAPDVINVHYASGYGTLARMSRIGPVLLSIWGSDVYDFPYESAVKKRILQKNVRYASGLASTSHCMGRQLRKVMNDSSLEIAVTPFGVDLDAFDPNRFEEMRTDKIVLGNIKTLAPKYGIGDFIQATALLLQKLKDAGEDVIAEKIQVEIYGDGPQKGELAIMISELSLEQVVFLKGWVPNTDVPKILSNFDVFCATSVLNSESFGVAAVEAMAMSVSVVVSDADGFKEVVVDQTTGLIVPRGDVNAIAQALERLVCDAQLRRTMGQNGRAHVKEYYDFKKNVDTMEELYRMFRSQYGK